MPISQKKIIIFTGLVKISRNLVGTAVIYPELARGLNQAGFKVSMVGPEMKQPGVDYYVYHKKNNEKLIRGSSAVIFGSYPPIEPMEYARKNGKNIITYMWSIAPIGSLEFRDFKSFKRQDELHRFIVDSYNKSLKYSDKIFCRDERAREVIVGSLITLGRVDLAGYRIGHNFDSLVQIAPFGLSWGRPRHNKNIYRGVAHGIKQDDFIMLWNGGVWNRTDAPGMVKIMKHIWPKNRKIKLVFQGFYNPHGINTSEAKEAWRLLKKFELLNKNIFIPDKWIEFDERDGYLAEADAGITLSPNIPDANYFIKTRFYDYLWAELPIILNRCESFTSEVEKYGLGLVLAGDYKRQAWEIVKFVGNKKLQTEIRSNIREYKQGKSWDKQLKPVVEYCQKVN